MSVQNHLSRQAHKFSHCQGLPIIHQCHNNVDFHPSCVGARLPSCKQILKRTRRTNCKAVREQKKTRHTCKLNFKIQIK